MKLEVVTLTVSKYGVTVAISSYFFLFAVVSRHGSYVCSQPHAAASLPLGLSLTREGQAREGPS